MVAVLEIRNVNGSLTKIEIEITCNKTLSDQFNFKDLERNEYFGKQEPFEVKLDSYWIKQKNILKCQLNIDNIV